MTHTSLRSTRAARILIFLLRISLGWMFLFAAIRQIPDATWSAAGFLSNASLFPGFFAFFASPEILPLIDATIPWAHLLIGISLIVGIGARLSAFFGAVLMILYYLPRLEGFMVGPNNFIVEYHLVYALVLLYLASIRAGEVYGLSRWFVERSPLRSFFGAYPWMKRLLA